MSSFAVNIILPFLCIHLTWESNNYHQMSLWFVSYNCSWSYCMYSFGSSYLWYLSNIIHLCTVDIPVYILQYQFQTITSFTITVYRKNLPPFDFYPFCPPCHWANLKLGEFKQFFNYYNLPLILEFLWTITLSFKMILSWGLPCKKFLTFIAPFTSRRLILPWKTNFIFFLILDPWKYNLTTLLLLLASKVCNTNKLYQVYESYENFNMSVMYNPLF